MAHPNLPQITEHGASPSQESSGLLHTPPRSVPSYGTQSAQSPNISPHRTPAGSVPIGHGIVKRRQSVADRLSSWSDVGGPNSFSNFARSWQRAALFDRLSSDFGPDELHPAQGPTQQVHQTTTGGDIETGEAEPTSLLRAALRHERENRASEDNDIEDYEQQRRATIGEESSNAHNRDDTDNIFRVEPQDASPFGGSGSYGPFYVGSIPRWNEEAQRRASVLARHKNIVRSSIAPDKEQEPLIPKDDEDDTDEQEKIEGESTVPQTVFNAVNTLVGIGILSLPLAIKYTGWLLGMTFFLVSAFATSYTAKLLAKCLDVDQSLVTFGDIAYVAFGRPARVIVSALFSLELLACCVAMTILFADSMNALISQVSITEWKIICGIILIPLCFTPLRFLSFTSILGILLCSGIVIAIVVDGFIKAESPGSLRDVATTYVFPADWRTIPLAFGLLMAPWGGHSVFPNIYRDMRHPLKYSKAVNLSYGFSYSLDVVIAVVGYLMFGDYVRDEITSNIILTKGYPRWIELFLVIAVAIVPLTKTPLTARPIISTIEVFSGLELRARTRRPSKVGSSPVLRNFLRGVIRVLMPVLFVILAIVCPAFDRVMALLGSLLCFTICIILPCSFHLKIFGKDLSVAQRCLDWTLVIVCTILAAVGTVCSFLPKSMLGAE